jgi:type I restriction enzyme S subunit
MNNMMANIEIPIPSLETQNKIVSILDKFDTIVNDIKEGLPKEIELRHKAYEYYRNKLLTFPSYDS